MNLRLSTARTVTVGPILDATGAAKTDEIVASVLASKNGGAYAALDGSATLSHSQTGYYLLALTANDISDLGCLEIALNSDTNVMPVARFNVMTGGSWDAMYGATWGNALPVNVVKVNGTSQTAKDLGASVTQTGDAYSLLGTKIPQNFTFNSVGGTQMPAVNVRGVYGTALAAAKIAATLATGDVTGNLPANVKQWNTGSLPTFPSNFGSMVIDGSGIVRAYDSAGAAVATATAVGAIPTNPLTTLGANAPGGWLNEAAFAASALNGKGDWNTTTPPTAAAIADAVLDEVLSGHATAGTAGKALADAAGNAGSGARAVTVTLSPAVQNAKVRFTAGASTFTATTNSSGIATFSLDDATYTLTITAAGYTYTPTSRAVDGTEAWMETITAIAIPAATDPTETTAYLYAYDEDLELAADVEFEVRLYSADGTAGRSYPRSAKSLTSDANGLVQVTLKQASVYDIRRLMADGTKGPWKKFTTGTASTYAIPEVLGRLE